MNIHKTFTTAYLHMLEDVYCHPQFISSPRGMKIKETLGYQFRITNPRARLPYVSGRDFSISYMVAELIWYLSGNNSTSWIANYSSFWNNISDDGKTANSAYGARIFKQHEYQKLSSITYRDPTGHFMDVNTKELDPTWNQWQYCLDELAADNDSRRAVMHIRMPQDSIEAHKDVPCTLTLQFILRDDKLHMIVNMRSSDIILGIAYDVPAFTIFQEYMANCLTLKLGRSIELGDYTHVSAC